MFYFSNILIVFNKHAYIDVDITAADIMQLFSKIKIVAYLLDMKRAPHARFHC